MIRSEWRMRALALVFALASIVRAEAWAQSTSVAPAEFTPPAVLREMRAAWISPVENADWPSRPGLSVDSQKAELRAALDRAQRAGLNAVFLHVRVAGDAMYPSKRAPWSRYLVGRGGTPGAEYEDYDPLQLAIEEAHARGLQLHAWFNPFRAMPPDDLGPPLPGHVTRTHPAWVKKYGKQTWIDPGIPEARRAVLDAILEVAERYDVDGIHIDDYFYPYLEERTVRRRVRRGKRRVWVSHRETIPFPDAASWKKYGRGKGWDNRESWRRANIDGFVRTLYGEVKKRKPYLLVGISPFGIWRPGSPPGITGLDSYSEIFADSRRWLREGWLDYIAPQLYWELDGVQNRFARLDAWWRGEDVRGRHVWPGLFTMGVDSPRDPWAPGEITREISFLRAAREGTTESLGHVHFRLGTMSAMLPGDTIPYGDVLRATVYSEPAIPPASPWLGAARPATPLIAREGSAAGTSGGTPASGDVGDDRLTPAAALAVTAGDSVPVAWWLVQTLTADGRWITRLWPAHPGHIPLPPSTVATVKVVVTPISRTGVSGEPATF